jgi:DNA-binding SARP family transcriptional activator
MEYRVLGPLEVLRDDTPVDVGGPRQQIVLAVLLLEAGRIVTSERLVDAVWSTNPPATARSQIHICMSSLRRLLAADPTSSAILTRKPGYVLTLGDDTLDLQTFADLVARGRQRAAADEPGPAIDLFRAALALWRGSPFAGPASTSTIVSDHAVRLEEQRSAVLNDCIELELSLGQHVQLISELRGEIERDPLRESTRGQLMTALYRAGRQADALREYRTARAMSVSELGIEPSDELRGLEQRILRADPALNLISTAATVAVPDPPQRPPVAPRLLPAPVADFTGRETESRRLVEHLSAAQEEDRFSVPVALVTGSGGVGKSSLLLHVAHRLAETYPGGQLYADLHDEPGPATTGRILERFLKALRHPANEMPDDPDERAELYRNLLAGRRVLVCLDDVHSESQVRMLMPGTAGCAVVVTSRRRLTAVPGGLRIQLTAFRPEDSLRLLELVAGTDRIAADITGARALAQACGNLPLAVRIAAARLAARPHWQLSVLADRLSDEDTRLNELQHGELAVRASVSVTYDNLSEAARGLFHLLSLLDVPDFDAWVAGALLDTCESEVEDILDELVEMHLVDTQPVDDRLRYRFHNLIRSFAREQAVRLVSTEARHAALSRALGALLFLCGEAHNKAYGGDYLMVHGTAERRALDPALAAVLVADPLAFYDREHAMVVSGVRQAAAMGAHSVAWEMALCAVTGFEAHYRLQDWCDTHDVALRAARRHGDRLGEASMLYSLGSLHVLEQHLPDADRLLRVARDIFDQIGSRQGTALVLRNQAYMDQLGGRADLARERGQEALEIFRAVADPVGQASALRNLAQLELDAGRPGDALLLLHEAAEICAGLENRRVSAQVLHRLAETLMLIGELEQAEILFGQVLDLVRTTQDQVGEAYALLGGGLVALRRSRFSAATGMLRRAGQLAVNTGEQRVRGRVDLGMGEVLLAAGRRDEALRLFERAAQHFRDQAAPVYEARAQLLIEEVRLQAGMLQNAGAEIAG